MDRPNEERAIQYLSGMRGETTDVYAMFVGEGGIKQYVKIGYSVCPGLRVQGVRTGCPMPMVEVISFGCPSETAARTAEAAIHSALAEFRTHGEWFRCDDLDLVMATFEVAALGHGCKSIARVDSSLAQKRERKRKKMNLQYCRALAG